MESEAGTPTDADFARTWEEVYTSGTTARAEGNSAGTKEPVPGGGISSYQKAGEAPLKKRGARKRLAALLLAAAALYGIAVFSDIQFIVKWRTIYIETAMGTMTHQWLATAFIPKGVIEKAMAGSYTLDRSQDGLSSGGSISPFLQKELYLPWDKAQSRFSRLYPEIDRESFDAYIKKNPDSIPDGGDCLVIDKAGLNDKGTTIKTVHGDQVLAIDTENAITIVKVTGEGYVGRLAIVKDPSRVGVGVSGGFNEKGDTVANLARHNDAVLAINASGFYDPDGHGNGGNVYGLVISGGKVLNPLSGGNYKTIGFDRGNRLNIGQYKSLSAFRDAVEFKPALIVDGKVLVEGSAGWGIQPRSAIGQTKNGEVLMLIVDGRLPGYSIGCTIGEAAKILKRYGAVQACNLDGGSSSLMYYNGREISRPSAANKTNGRGVPDGFVVYER